ncbi:basic amino acid ABC transporter substrate-binding protein [Desulfohalobium retbaense]|uniref:Extracellular solute-binding protein family 3 n=1 Tax=Desulfohalobium retbaense (strain ATCC 49708 / DSM 5692 / JCM 16813 / HR100) TaxID=485915 RepID=C8X2I6_DESRD|nr:basic amino acid ABC transporter substrate-binding protein [Desulfohalobium retbaense]ACV68633.1 extracellular solute-binding protein family 3 [Desulfohalobium retbaense DSM 5692]
MLKKLLFTVLAICLGAQMAVAKEIVFAVDATWPPMEFVNSEKEIVGYSIDFMTAAAEEAGFTPVFKNVAWDGIFAGLAGGNYDAICSSVSITEERKEAMDFSEPYFQVQQALVVPKDVEAKTLEDLEGEPVGAQIGTTGYFTIKDDGAPEPKSYDEIGLAMQDLLNGRLAGVVCDDPVAANYAKQEEGFSDALKIAAILESDTEEYYGIALKKGNEDLLKLINKGIRAVKDKGLDAELRAKWIE